MSNQTVHTLCPLQHITQQNANMVKKWPVPFGFAVVESASHFFLETIVSRIGSPILTLYFLLHFHCNM